MARKTEKLEVIKAGEGKWLVPSGTKEGVVYEVRLEDGRLICNCPAGWDGKMCKHKRAVMEVEQFLEVEEERKMDEKTKATKHGYRLDEVTSAYQKEIRRRDEERALFWGMELYETAPYYFWKRTLIMAAEDTGLASPQTVQQVTALAQAWEFCKRTSWWVDPQHVVMAILLLSRAPKSTEVDDAKNYIMERRKKGWRLQVPDYAVDIHTEQGRQMGRTDEDWYRERNKVIPGNPYREALEELRKGE